MKRVSRISTLNYKRFIQDFNILTLSSRQSNALYQRPQSDSVEEQYNKTLLRNPQGMFLITKGEEYSLGCNIDEFKIFGPGIYLLFKFLKLLVILFTGLSIIMFANLIFNSLGNGIKDMNYNTDTFIAKMARTTLGNIDIKYCQATSLIYFVALIIFTATIIYWKQMEQSEVIECSKQNLLPSYYTVILNNIPQGYSQNAVKLFLQEHFGRVKQIFSAKQFHNDLMHYKEINEILEEYKIQRGFLNRNRQKNNCLKLMKLFKEFYQYYKKMKSQKRGRYQPAFAFITFFRVSARQKLLETYADKKRLWPINNNAQISFKTQDLVFSSCKMEPDAINWENITLPTGHIILRVIFQIALMIIVLIISIAVIYLLALAQTNLINPKYSQYTQIQIQKMNNPTATKYFCLSLSTDNFYQSSYCHPYEKQFQKIFALQLILPLIISLLKFIFTELMNSIVSFRRHANEIKKLQSQMVIMFIFYFIVSGLLQLAINIQITAEDKVISIKQFFQSYLGFIYNLFPVDQDIVLPSDFTASWFFYNSTNIILISLISFNFTSIFNILYYVLAKKVALYLAAKQPTYRHAQKYLKAAKFQIEYLYAFVIGIIFFTLLFGPVIPLVWIFGSFSLFVLYWTHKCIFIRYSRKPLAFSHSINHVVIRMVLFGIVLSSFISPLLYGGIRGQSLVQRYISYMYYPILGGLILVYMFFKKVILNFIYALKDYCKGMQMGRSRLPSLISRIKSSSDELPSYSMHQNRTYSPVLKVLYTLNSNERTRNTFMLNQNLSQFFEFNQSNKGPNSFKELISQVKHDRQKFNKTHHSKYFSNPFGQSIKIVKELTKIYHESKSKIHRSSSQQNSSKVSNLSKVNSSFKQQLKGYQLCDKIVQRPSQLKDQNDQQNLGSQRNIIQTQLGQTKNKQG